VKSTDRNVRQLFPITSVSGTSQSTPNFLSSGAGFLSKEVWNNRSRLTNTKFLIYKTAGHLRSDEALCDTPLA
jgi:hypothetical protein